MDEIRELADILSKVLPLLDECTHTSLARYILKAGYRKQKTVEPNFKFHGDVGIGPLGGVCPQNKLNIEFSQEPEQPHTHKWAIHPLTKTEWCEVCHVGRNEEEKCPVAGCTCLDKVHVYEPKEQKCTHKHQETFSNIAERHTTCKDCGEVLESKTGLSEPKEQKYEHEWSKPATGNGYMCCMKDGCNAYTFYGEPKDSVKCEHSWVFDGKYMDCEICGETLALSFKVKSYTPPYSVKWPEKKDVAMTHHIYDQGLYVGWNACLEECKRLNEKEKQ